MSMNFPPLIQSLLKSLTLEEKVGQLFLLAFAGNNLNPITPLIVDYGLGGCYLSQENASNPEEAKELTQSLQKLTQKTSYQIPLILGVDHEGTWGVLAPYSTTGPGNLALGAAGKPELTHKIYNIFGKEMLSFGFNAIFAPCADCNSNPQNAIIGMRSFGEYPNRVADQVVAAVKGANASGIISTLKHFPGHGDTSLDSHRSLPTVNKNFRQLEQEDLYPFQRGIDAGVDMIMTSHILFPQIDSINPATLSHLIMGHLLRKKMGFNGVVLTDSMNMGAIKKNYPSDEAAIKAIQAGVDMIMLAEEHYDHDSSIYIKQHMTLIQSVIQAVKSGRITPERLDEASGRILTLKFNKGIFPVPTKTFDLKPQFGLSDHVSVALEAASSAITVLRDRSQFWPINLNQPLIIINCVPRDAYAILSHTRGIGPNQSEPAFDIFQNELIRLGVDIKVYHYEDLKDESIPVPLLSANSFIAVTEDYPLPGTDFETNLQKKLVNKLSVSMGERMIVLAFRSSYELSEFPLVSTYLCTYSSRPCSALAAAQAVMMKKPLTGRAPISVL
jgi:beta-N-acetylhexosaminidase